MLEDRARSGGKVVEHALEPDPMRKAAAGVESRPHPPGRGAPRLESRRQLRHGVDTRRRARGDVEGRLFVPDAGRSAVPPHLPGEVHRAYDAGVRAADDGARDVDGHLDRTVGPRRPSSRPLLGPQRRGSGQRCRPGVQDGRPRTLLPGERAGVLDVHPGVSRRQLATAQQPAYVVRQEPELEQLSTGDDAGLVGQLRAEVFHRPRMPRRGHPPLMACGRRCQVRRSSARNIASVPSTCGQSWRTSSSSTSCARARSAVTASEVSATTGEQVT